MNAFLRPLNDMRILVSWIVILHHADRHRESVVLLLGVDVKYGWMPAVIIKGFFVLFTREGVILSPSRQPAQVSLDE